MFNNFLTFITNLSQYNMKSPYHEEGSFHVNFLPLPVTEKSDKKISVEIS